MAPKSSIIHHQSSIRRGFILAFAITALALVGLVMFVLAGGANAMLFHADTAYLQAVERNLVASGLAWVREQVSSGRDLTMGPSIELDTAGFTASDTRLAVHIIEVRESTARIHIETSCRKGRRILHASRDYIVPVSSVP